MAYLNNPALRPKTLQRTGAGLTVAGAGGRPSGPTPYGSAAASGGPPGAGKAASAYVNSPNAFTGFDPVSGYGANTPMPGNAGHSGTPTGASAAEQNPWTPYYATPAPQANQRTAEQLTGMPSETSPYLETIFGGLAQAPDVMGTKSSVTDPNLGTNAALAKGLAGMSGLERGDFGIPQDIRQKLEVASAQSINPQYEAQKQAAKRMAARMGLTNDSAAAKGEAGIEQGRIGAVTGATNKIETDSALAANQQYLDNMKNLVSGGTSAAQLAEQAAQQAEQSRQFNVGGQLDVARFGSAQAEAEDRMRLNRESMNNSVAQWLADYEMRRQRLGAGLADSASQQANEQNSQFISSLYGPMSYGQGTGNYFGSAMGAAGGSAGV